LRYLARGQLAGCPIDGRIDGMTVTLAIPEYLKPADGRFGSGPSRVRAKALESLAAPGSPMGTSHRQAPVKNVVASIQEQLAALYSLPDGYEVVLGNGGTNVFWDVATASLIERRSAHGVCGEFSRKFADAVALAPFLEDPAIDSAALGCSARPQARDGVDVYGWVHNETSTGVCVSVERVAGAGDALMLVDATSAAGGMAADVGQLDAYYFSPQKNMASDGGLWLALCSPAALERSARVTASGRWVPPTLNLTLAAQNSSKHQTLNTPAIATLMLLDVQLRWLLYKGGLEFAIERTCANSSALYKWASKREFVRPFVEEPGDRSPVVVTLVFDETVNVSELTAIMRANGIVDIDAYRNAGPNQIRVGCFAAVDPGDIEALIACLDWVIDRLPVR